MMRLATAGVWQKTTTSGAGAGADIDVEKT